MVIGTKGNKAPRRGIDHWGQLERHMTFLRRSCATFDGGDYDEAIRIALTIRVLVHDTNLSTSLLTLLGIKDQLSYVDTGIYRNLFDAALQEWVEQTDPAQKVAATSPSDVGLVELGDAGGGRVGWYAPLRLRRFAPGTPPDRATKGQSSFVEWWETPLVETTKNQTFSRANLVLIMANQEAGHADEQLDADYQDLIEDPLLQMEHGIDLEDKAMGDEVPDALHNIAYASVRQIAFELMLTVDRFLLARNNPGILVLANPYASLPMPTPPHRPMQSFSPIVITSK